MSVVFRSSFAFACALLLPSNVAAQSTTTPPSTARQAAESPDPDLKLNPAEPEFTLGALPTTLRLPAGKFAFRLTHRFSRPIASGSAGDFFADFFGFDSSARVGLEVRYGIRPGTQVTVSRTNLRTIQFLGQQQLLRQADGRPLTVDAVVAVEGANNFSENFSGTFGAVLSRQFSEHGAVYLEPVFVANANPVVDPIDDDDHTFLIGIGTRIRIGQTRAYLVAEAAPRVTGYDAGVDHVSVGIEKRAGGHMFQFTVTNSMATSMRQVAIGGPHKDDWFVGFNLTRKFF